MREIRKILISVVQSESRLYRDPANYQLRAGLEQWLELIAG